MQAMKWMAVMAVLVMAGAVQADWSSVDDFESYTANSRIVGQNGWTNSSDSPVRSYQADAVADPDGDGKVLLFKKTGLSGGMAYLVNDSSGYAGLTGSSPQTLFMRFRYTSNTNLQTGNPAEELIGFGVTPDANIPYDDSGLTEMKQGFAVGDPDNDGDADSLMNPQQDVGTNLLADTWYNLWLVTDNQAPDSAKLYIQSSDDTRFSSQAEIAVSNTWIRGEGALAYDTLYFVANHVDGPDAYIDDIYYDNSGENLVNPIPEPATLGLMATVAGGVFLLRRFRR
ncbi:PEP-CTERM sorting domain-containing protein [Kiritimatiella glycovorans]|uniref:PEP-CTERM protein-sorting domain-containing protein n=1 Tax=Kiritimatiella glycovorans TaxID=1307763 RepID=A0A0G3EFR9_9BACT|nr:PEP-CTERM sorting domain-containing protein [Kiritimatiella glycovorans]AKJ63650.1 hypothetical protein L21SP4_00370 [Kiritimatiella glycovorans]